MHRIASVPGADQPEDISLVEQPSAPILLLTSASTDIYTLSSTLNLEEGSKWRSQIRALQLSSILHPAQVDHYISTTVQKAKLVIVRIYGDRGYWSYGLEKIESWSSETDDRYLIVLSGTKDNEESLHAIGNIENHITQYFSELFREGGVKNTITILSLCSSLIKYGHIKQNSLTIDRISTFLKWDIKSEAGMKVLIVYYTSLYKSGELKLPSTLNKLMRDNLISPKSIFISSLRDPEIQNQIKLFVKREKIEAIVCATSFSSINPDDLATGSEFWKNINLPIFQIITSLNSKDSWERSSIGLDNVDLCMQVVLPEIDGRIITKPCAFRNITKKDNYLYTAIKEMQPYNDSILWLISHIKKWISLRYTDNREKKIALILANYPIRDSRIANGVGLDTPSSIIQMIKWLKEEGYNLGPDKLPNNSRELIKMLISSRTNSPDTQNNNPLSYYPLESYLTWWRQQSNESRNKLISRWNEPSNSHELENNGFPIHGIEFGNIVILIQPPRGYDPFSENDIHSPDLAPPHRYIAQYLWVRDFHKSHCIVHVGKHGTLEWLPGKAVGLSPNCFPSLILESIPNIYPFIVNDPGEGSQAKRRTNALIIDHLTPPLARAELYGKLYELEGVLDEYFSSLQLGSNRSDFLRNKAVQLIKDLEMTNSKDLDTTDSKVMEKLILETDSYLCELKEAQIRTGLHTFGKRPKTDKLIDLMLSISRSPNNKRIGLTQFIAKQMNLRMDPWCDDLDNQLESKDVKILKGYIKSPVSKVGDVIAWIEEVSKLVLEILLDLKKHNLSILPKEIQNILIDKNRHSYLTEIKSTLWNKLYASPQVEKISFMESLCGHYVESGPSGAPTRGREDVLPTGRNFYSIDLRGIPTEAAWDLGVKSANKVLELNLLEKGQHLVSLGVSVWGTSTMRNGGEEIAQLLSLIGVKPIWDGKTRRVVDLEVIPLSVLERPRVDVTLRISGLFRDSFPNLVKMVYRAQKLVANLNETKKDNPYAYIVKKDGHQNRIYGSAPGSYGAGLQELISSGNWETKDDLAKAYISWSKWAYDEDVIPTLDQKGFEDTLSKVEMVLHNQDNREHDILDSDDYYQFHGGMAASVECLSSKKPLVIFGDHSNIDNIKVKKLTDEIDKVVRSRVLNPKWIEGMRDHSYKGAFEMAATLDYLFAYDATTNLVPSWCYSSINKDWVDDQINNEFLLNNNPWALRDIIERLIEAYNRGLWREAPLEVIDRLKSQLISIDSKIENGDLLN